MDDEHNDQDLENVLNIALHRKLKSGQIEEGYTEKEILNILTNDGDVDEEVAEKALKDYKSGNLSDEENSLIALKRKGVLNYLTSQATSVLAGVKKVTGYLIQRQKKVLTAAALASALAIS